MNQCNHCLLATFFFTDYSKYVAVLSFIFLKPVLNVMLHSQLMSGSSFEP